MDGVTTRFTLDLAAGLTQVLADGSNTYLYGAGRIAQVGANGPEYFLGDALDSVRQLVDGSGAVIMAKGYEPYGEALSSDGNAQSGYGFTGEWTSNASDLVYLRARWYAPWDGRFVSRDTWTGDFNRPVTLNKWNYAYSNPIRFTDPTGKDPIGACITLFATLAVVDGPLPVGEAAGAIACLALLGGAAYTAVIAAQHAPDLAEGVDTACKTNWIEWLYTRPVNPNPQQRPDPKQKPTPQPVPFPSPQPKATETPEPKFILYHYSSDTGVAGILASQEILPSLADDNRAAFGHGQYFTDLSLLDASIGSSYQLSRAIYNTPWKDADVTNYVAIDVSGLMIERVSPVFSRTYGDRSICLHRSAMPLPIGSRIISPGKVNFSR